MKTNRRNFIKGAGAAGGLALYGAASTQYPRISPVGRAEAIPPVIIAGAAVAAGGLAVGWTLREFEVIGADSPPEGLTADSLKSQVYQTARTRQSTNASTFIDNANLVDGIQHSAYAEGKIAAIDALNAEKTQSDVQAAATSVADDYATTVKTNFLKGWNESINELEALTTAVSNHSDLSLGDVWEVWDNGNSDTSAQWDPLSSISFGTVTTTLPDGSSFDVKEVTVKESGSGTWTSLNKSKTSNSYGQANEPDKGLRVDGVTYLRFDEWNPLWSEMSSTFDTVRNGLITWVEGVYSDVQSGELDTAELLTPRELAAMSSDHEQYNQAVADLMALNIPTNLKREAEVHIPSKGITVYGSLAVTGETTLSVGTVDPTADSYSYYLTYDVSQGSGSWSSYNTGVDGGQVALTEEPYDGVEYHITTGANETAVVDGGNFTAQNSTWVADVSDQLNTSITNVTSVDFYAPSEQVQYETVQLTEPFEIISFTDSDGVQYDSAAYSRSAPQDDTNYITQAEWDALKSRQEELIDKYEQASSGGGGGGFSLGGGDTPLLLVAAGAIVALVMGGRR